VQLFNFHLLKCFIVYQFKAKHSGGHGIHSPFLFDLLTNVIENTGRYYAYGKIADLRFSYLSDNLEVKKLDFGAGSKVNTGEFLKVCDIAKNAAIQPKYGELLFRLVEFFKPATVLELGTSLGISTAYLASPSSKTTVWTIEGNPELSAIAREKLREFRITNINFHVGQFDHCLPEVLNKIGKPEFVFFDGNHAYEPTTRYFDLVSKHLPDGSVLIFDDIYWSAEMTKAWQFIISKLEFGISIDIFQLGIIIWNKKFLKQHYIIRF
jgi:hypothetical protein